MVNVVLTKSGTRSHLSTLCPAFYDSRGDARDIYVSRMPPGATEAVRRCARRAPPGTAQEVAERH
eukprot:5415814-Lingulodinium_polyedra.AAC.1